MPLAIHHSGGRRPESTPEVGWYKCTTHRVADCARVGTHRCGCTQTCTAATGKLLCDDLTAHQTNAMRTGSEGNSPVAEQSHCQQLSALTLQWHAGASAMPLEAIQPWCLATLKPQLEFDAAIWALISEAAPIGGAHLHRVASAVLDQLEAARSIDFSIPARAGGSVLNVCIADPAWAGEAHARMREHARRFGLANTLSVSFVDAHGPGRQVLLVARKKTSRRFTIAEARLLGMLAPHMMLAYATARKRLLEGAQATERCDTRPAVAMIDQHGALHDCDARFVPMLRREWSDWRGDLLPESLGSLAKRRAGTRWRFLGTQVLADFMPVDSLYLVTARPRHLADALTPREREVAQHYAAGDSFREIAETLVLAPATVRSHLRSVFVNLGVRNKAQLAAALR